ncbi:MAG: flippase-like domain-containing protein [Deltaproteobacteria bacterium]|nr:flippase-like domain-containing protein [Deltaproteobacteria bacterium]
MSPQRKRQIFNALGIVLSGVFLYFCFRSMDAEALKKAFLLPRPWYLLGVLVLNFALMAVRTLLWSELLQPLAPIPFGTLFDVLHIGSMANNLLPLKAGEFFRSSFIAKKFKLSYTQVLTTVGLERYFPGFSLILLLLLVANFLQVPTWLKTGAYSLGAILVGVQVLLILLWKRKPDLAKWEKRHRAIYRIVEFFYHIGEASQPLRSFGSFSWLFFIGLVSWIVQIGMLLCIEAAFQVKVGVMPTAFVLVAINFATAIPSAPSNLGTFEFAAVLAYTWLGLDKATALGIGFYFHFLQAIPITLVGLFFYFRWGVRLKDLESEELETAKALQ